jgi:hypothetical protein
LLKAAAIIKFFSFQNKHRAAQKLFEKPRRGAIREPVATPPRRYIALTGLAMMITTGVLEKCHRLSNRRPLRAF